MSTDVAIGPVHKALESAGFPAGAVTALLWIIIVLIAMAVVRAGVKALFR